MPAKNSKSIIVKLSFFTAILYYRISPEKNEAVSNTENGSCIVNHVPHRGGLMYL